MTLLKYSVSVILVNELKLKCQLDFMEKRKSFY